MAENYLVLAFSMFDRQKKGYISTDDLKEVFEILGESITDDEVNTMIKIAGIKSNDKINFKEFVDFFYKIDWIWLNILWLIDIILYLFKSFLYSKFILQNNHNSCFKSFF